MAVAITYDINEFQFRMTCNARIGLNGVCLGEDDISLLDNPDYLYALKLGLRLHKALSMIESIQSIAGYSEQLRPLIDIYVVDCQQQLQSLIDDYDGDSPIDFAGAIRGNVAMYRGLLEDAYHNLPKAIAAHSANPKPGYVYLLESDKGYKIGMSKTPKKRIKTMGVQLPFPIETIAIIKTEDMRGTEKYLHDRFAEERINGEWFDLSLLDVQFIKGLQS